MLLLAREDDNVKLSLGRVVALGVNALLLTLLSELRMQQLQTFESASELKIEKTRRKAGENTVEGRLEGDEGIE